MPRDVLVQVTGGPGMTLSEVEILMHELNKHISEHTQILFGTAVDGRMGDRLSVTLISSLPADEAEVAPRKSKAHGAPPPPPPPEPVVEPAAEPQIVQFVQPEATSRAGNGSRAGISGAGNFAPEPVKRFCRRVKPPESQFAEAQWSRTRRPSHHAANHSAEKETVDRAKVERKTQARKGCRSEQEILQFEPLTRGRFEKSEPTIVEGQDLDVRRFCGKRRVK